MTTEEIAALAEAIADDLFTNGGGNKAHRLELQDRKGRGLGGWGFDALVYRVACKIQDALAADPE